MPVIPGEFRNLQITAKTTNATLKHEEAGVIAAADGVTLTLPAAATSTGVRYLIKVTNTHSAGVVVDGNSTELVDGAQTKTSGAQYDMLDIISNGTKWLVIGSLGTWS